MNRVYQVVWNQSKRVWQTASELGRRQRGQSSSGHIASSLQKITAGTLFLFALPLHAVDLPTGGQVVAGQGSIHTNGSTLTVQQNSQNLAIDWQSFSIAEGNKVQFVQPNAQAAALNRVTGDQVSEIRGALSANGRVFLINPNGIMFSAAAQVDVGALVASTLDIATDDFMAGDYRFEGTSSNAIINRGNITSADGGYVALIAAQIINSGQITTLEGSTLMGAGNCVTLDLGGPVKIEVEEALLETYIEQGGAIRADGGLVYLTAKAAGELASSVINHTGITEARTLATGKRGQIMLMGDVESGITQVAGTLDASAPNGGDGGFIETSAAKVHVGNTTQITTHADHGQTGEWLIDPQDYIIAATDGDMTGSQLSNFLNNTDITIQSVDGGTAGNGDIFVNDSVAWSSGNTLELFAERNIEINASIDASQGAGGKLTLLYGQGAVAAGNTAYYRINAPASLQAGQNFSSQLGSDGATRTFNVITDAITLQNINSSSDYALGAGIDLSAIPNWTPLGSYQGTFEGLGNTIANLTVNTANNAGLFASLSANGTIQNLTLANVDITGVDFVGAVAGYLSGRLNNVRIEGSVTGNDFVGGVAGMANSGNSSKLASLEAVVTNITVTGNNYVGGLVGSNAFSLIHRSASSGTVTGVQRVGGLVGLSDAGGGNTLSGITHSYSTATVYGEAAVGGLVGYLTRSKLESSYASNSVSLINGSSSAMIGGLLGSGSALNSWYNIDANNSTGLRDRNVYGRTATQIIGSNTWDSGIWAFVTDAGHAGYGLSLPYLAGVTTAGATAATLFDGGFGTAATPYTITNWQQLANINFNTDVLSGNYHFELANDLNGFTLDYDDLAGTTAHGGDGWVPLGTQATPFSGTFDGQGHSIERLYIHRNATDGSGDYIGLFGYSGSGATLTDIQLVSAYVVGNNWVGSLVGRSEGVISNSSTNIVNVQGVSAVGGLAGDNYGTATTSYSTGQVSGQSNVGGLFGYSKGSIANTYTQVIVSATGGGSDIGGLVGENNSNGGSITDSYAANYGISGNGRNMGGLVGNNTGTVTRSFFDKTLNSGLADEASFGKTTLEMQDATTFAGWSLTTTGGGSSIWRLYEGTATPLLRHFMTTLTVSSSTSSVSKIYDGTTNIDFNALSLSWITADNSPLNSSLLLGSPFQVSSKNVGNRTLVNNYYSSQNGYDIVVGSLPTVTITPKDLTVTGISANNKVYDGTTDATWALNGVVFNGGISGDILYITSATATFSDKNVGQGKTVTISNIVLNGADAGNYTLNSAVASADIAPRAVSVVAENQSKQEGTVDPTLTYTVGCGVLTADCGLVNGEALTGALSRQSGEEVGGYDILQGSLTDSANPNYVINYTQGEFLITAAPASNPDSGQNPAVIAAQHDTANSLTSPQPENFSAFANNPFNTPTPSSQSQAGSLQLIEIGEPDVASVINGNSTHNGNGLLNLYVVNGGLRIALDDGSSK